MNKSINTAIIVVIIIMLLGAVLWRYRNTALLSNFLGSNTTQVNPTDDTQTYTNASGKYTVQYPKEFTLDSSYTYSAMGPGKEISGVKFIIPQSMATGTNLSSDSGVSIEQVAGGEQCTPATFLDTLTSSSTLQEQNATYLVGRGGGAAAGNLYEEYVYVIASSTPCTAIRYFIHSTQLGNYPEGAVVAFDQAALVAKFDAIRRSLTFTE